MLSSLPCENRLHPQPWVSTGSLSLEPFHLGLSLYWGVSLLWVPISAQGHSQRLPCRAAQLCPAGLPSPSCLPWSSPCTVHAIRPTPPPRVHLGSSSCLETLSRWYIEELRGHCVHFLCPRDHCLSLLNAPVCKPLFHRVCLCFVSRSGYKCGLCHSTLAWSVCLSSFIFKGRTIH